LGHPKHKHLSNERGVILIRCAEVRKNGKYILIEDPIKAFDYAVNKFDNILVSGSLYFISDIKSYLAKKINIHPHEMLEYYFKDMVGTLE